MVLAVIGTKTLQKPASSITVIAILHASSSIMTGVGILWRALRSEILLLKRKKYVQLEIEKRFGIKEYDVKFDIVAHSMGGLAARYYLR